MATNYKADNYTNPFPDIGQAGVLMCREFLYTIGAAIVINDLFKLSPIKAGTGIVLDYYFIDVPALDSGATPTVTLDVGDNTSAAKYVAAATVGQATGYLTPSVNGVHASLPASYTADNDFNLLAHAAPQTSATSGTIRGYITFHGIGVATVV